MALIQSTPKPVLTLFDLSFPLASSDLGADTLENEFIMTNMHLSQASIPCQWCHKTCININFLRVRIFVYNFQIQRTIEERVVSGLDTASLDDEAFNLEASLDRCILRLIASCCNGKHFFSLPLYHYKYSKLRDQINLSLEFAFFQATNLSEPLN